MEKKIETFEVGEKILLDNGAYRYATIEAETTQHYIVDKMKFSKSTLRYIHSSKLYPISIVKLTPELEEYMLQIHWYHMAKDVFYKCQLSHLKISAKDWQGIHDHLSKLLKGDGNGKGL